MMQALVPTYTLRIEIRDQLPELKMSQGGGLSEYAGLGASSHPPAPQYYGVRQYYDATTGQTGCDRVLATVREALAKAGVEHATVTLDRFEHR